MSAAVAADWFDFNEPRAPFLRLGQTAGRSVQTAAALLCGDANGTVGAAAAIRAARLSLPLLADLTKCDGEAVAAITAICVSLEETETALKKPSPARGRSVSLFALKQQASAVLAARWLKSLRVDPLTPDKASAAVAALVPKRMCETKRGESGSRKLSALEQLGAWEDGFSRKRDTARRAIIEDAYAAIIENCAASGKAPRELSAAQVLEWLGNAMQQ